MSFVEGTRSFSPLEQPCPLASQEWPEEARPLVSIICLTYQHQRFVTQTIEGFLAQETTFPVEILIHDDASTDGTADIVRDYAERYPRLIRTILQTENQYSQGRKGFPLLYAMARGDRIAICEGDDFWTDPRKLEIQNRYLDEHPEVVCCGHPVSQLLSDGTTLEPTRLEGVRTISLEEAISSGGFPPTLSTCFRKLPLPLNDGYKRIAYGDRFIFSYLINQGGMVMLPGDMATYRIHQGGMFSGASIGARHYQVTRVNREIAPFYPPRYRPSLAYQIALNSWVAMSKLIQLRNWTQAREMLTSYLRSFRLCLDGLFPSPVSWMRVFVKLVQIASVPLQHIFWCVKARLPLSSK